MPSFTQARPSSKGLAEHQWTAEQTYNLLDHILSNPKYTRNFFPTPGHASAPGILQRYAWTICMIVLKDTAWMQGMKEHFEGGRLTFDRRWVGDDPVTIRLKEMAGHYKERLGYYMRYEDIPPGSEYPKRWRKYERCPERRWVLKYFALKQIQAGHSMVAGPDSLLEAGPSTSTPAPARKKHAEEGDQASAQSNGSGSKKRPSIRSEPSSPSKRRRSTHNGSSTTQRPIVQSGDPEKQKEVIYVLDSDDDEPIPIPSKSRQTKRRPSPTFVGSDSDSQSEDDDDIRSVSPPIITLPSRSFALPPPDSPFRGTLPSAVRLAFQKPIDDTPTDSESEDEEINPPRTGMGMDMGVFSTISLTTSEDLVGMFTDPKLRPQQTWRHGLPTPPDSRGSGSSSPIKSAGRGWDGALTPEPEMGGQAGSGEDMDKETSLDNDDSEGLDTVRPMTPPLPFATLTPESILLTGGAQLSSPSHQALVNDHLITPPLPTHSFEPVPPRQEPDIIEIEDTHHYSTEAEREIAARLLRTLTGDNQAQGCITAMSIEQYPRLPGHQETSTGALSNCIASHAGSSVTTQGSSAVVDGRERRPLLDRMAPGILKGKGKQVEPPTYEEVQVHEINIEGTSYSVGTIKTSSTSTIQPGPAAPSTGAPTNATSIHTAISQVASSILDILIAQTHLKPFHHLQDYVTAFAPGHIPLRTKLGELTVALGGVVLEDNQVRGMKGRRYIIYPIGEGPEEIVDGLEEVDVLGFLEMVGNKIRGSA